MFAIAASSSATAAAAVAVPVAIKAVGELHYHVLQSKNNVLSRQGNGSAAFPGDADKRARQRTGGIKGELVPDKKAPSFLDKVPRKKLSGDNRVDYVLRRGNATSSRANIIDQLLKVPRKAHGATSDYQRAARPEPTRKAGFGNQSFTP